MSKYLKCFGFILLVEFIFIFVGGGYETLLVKTGISSEGDNIIFFLGFPFSLIIIIGLLFWVFPNIINQLKKWLKIEKKSIIFFLAGFLTAAIIFALIIFLAFITNILCLNNNPPEHLEVKFILKAITISLLIGSTEEVIYRGIVTAYFLENSNKIFTIVFVSLFFSAGHLNYIGILPYVSAFIIGVICTYLLFKTGSLFASIGLHAGWDFTYMIFKNDFLFKNQSGLKVEMHFELYQVAFLILFYLIISVWYFKRGKHSKA